MKIGNTKEQLVELLVAFIIIFALYPGLVENIMSSDLPVLYKGLLIATLPAPLSLLLDMFLASIGVIREPSIESFFTLYFVWLVITVIIAT